MSGCPGFPESAILADSVGGGTDEPGPSHHKEYVGWDELEENPGVVPAIGMVEWFGLCYDKCGKRVGDLKCWRLWLNIGLIYTARGNRGTNGIRGTDNE